MMLPSNKSTLGIRGDWPNGTYALSRIATASLNLGLGDFAFLLDTTITSDPGDCVIFSKTGGAPLRGYIFRYTGNALRITLYDAAGNPVHLTVPTVVERGRNPIVVFGDRDGNLEIYEKGVNVLTIAIGATNIDQDNGGVINCNYNSFPAYVAQDISGFQFYNFGVDGIPDGSERAQIVSEWTSDPYSIPPCLAARAGHTSELREHMDFLSEDPASTVVTDKSAYGSDLTLAAAAAWSDVGKEMKAPTRVLTPDGGPTFGIAHGYAAQAGLSDISVGVNDVIVEFLIQDYEQDIAVGKRSGNWHPTYFQLYNALGTHYIIFARFTTLFRVNMVDAGGPIYAQDFTDGIFGKNLHVFVIFRAGSVITLMNGHSLRTVAKVAHNIDSSHLILSSNSPGSSAFCLARIYTGDLSGFTDSALLDIHQKYISYPYETPADLLAYEKLRFTGRMPDGSQIPPASAVIYNEKNGEPVGLAGGLTWQDVREAVYV